MTFRCVWELDPPFPRISRKEPPGSTLLRIPHEQKLAARAEAALESLRYLHGLREVSDGHMHAAAAAGWQCTPDWLVVTAGGATPVALHFGCCATLPLLCCHAAGIIMVRTKQTARKSTGGRAPQEQAGRWPAGAGAAGHVQMHPDIEHSDSEHSDSDGPQITSVWHPLLITAADLGGRQRLFAGLAARQETIGSMLCHVHRGLEYRHPGAAGAYASAAAEAAISPFPLNSSFGLLPYAAFRGHESVVERLCLAGFSLKRTGLVSGSRPGQQCVHPACALSRVPHCCEAPQPTCLPAARSPPHQQSLVTPISLLGPQVLTVPCSAKWARKGLCLPARLFEGRFHDDTPQGLCDSVRANALQIACYKVGGLPGGFWWVPSSDMWCGPLCLQGCTLDQCGPHWSAAGMAWEYGPAPAWLHARWCVGHVCA